VDTTGLPADSPELRIAALLDQYRALREERLAGESRRTQSASGLLITGLQWHSLILVGLQFQEVTPENYVNAQNVIPMSYARQVEVRSIRIGRIKAAASAARSSPLTLHGPPVFLAQSAE
jgi:hypothetical protein